LSFFEKAGVISAIIEYRVIKDKLNSQLVITKYGYSLSGYIDDSEMNDVFFWNYCQVNQ
jgi:hypothetical protein